MPPKARGNNAIYLSLLQDHHAKLEASSSLAAPHYARAIASLTACPVPMNDVNALEDLEGFSPGLRRWLIQAVKEQGGEEVIKARQAKEKRGRTSDLSLLDALDVVDDQGEENDDELAVEGPVAGLSRSGSSAKERTTNKKTSAPAKKRKKTTAAGDSDEPKKKTYTPPQRSGGWGILMGLWLLTEQHASRPPILDNDDGDDPSSATTTSVTTPPHFSKDEVIATAKKYSRASYTHSVASRYTTGQNGARGHMTAWDTMKTLLKHGLVWQMGRPAGFALSEVGMEMARGIARVEGKLGDEGEEGGDEEGEAAPGDEEALMAGEVSAASSTTPRQPTIPVGRDDIEAEYDYIFNTAAAPPSAPAAAAAAASKRPASRRTASKESATAKSSQPKSTGRQPLKVPSSSGSAKTSGRGGRAVGASKSRSASSSAEAIVLSDSDSD